MLKNLVKVEILLFLSHWVSSRGSGSEGSLTYFTVCESRGFRKMWHQHNSTVAHQSNIWACHKFINRFLQKVLTKLTGKRILVLGTSRNYYFDHKKFQDIPRQIKSIQDIQLFLTLTPTPHPPLPPTWTLFTKANIEVNSLPLQSTSNGRPNFKSLPPSPSLAVSP